MKYQQTNYRRGQQELFYVSENLDLPNPPTVHCHAPRTSRIDETLLLLEHGVYHFNYNFIHLGKYVFIFFEDYKPTLITIVTIN